MGCTEERYSSSSCRFLSRQIQFLRDTAVRYVWITATGTDFGDNWRLIQSERRNSSEFATSSWRAPTARSHLTRTPTTRDSSSKSMSSYSSERFDGISVGPIAFL